SSNHYIDINVGDETVIPLKAVTKGLDVMGSMVQDSKVKKLLIGVKQYAAKSSHMTLRVKADYNDQQWQFATDLDESLVYGEGSFGQTIFGWQDTVTKEFPINRKTKRIQVSFISDNVAYRNEPIMIYGFVLLYKKKRPKGNRLGITRQTPDYEG
ncbi:MAG: hypothetical protein RRY35_08160, partial [Clostridiales bacterium]